MNILEIICHDLGRHLPCYGRGQVRAPALDRLAESGVVFTNHFTASICCTPSRGCLRTSTYAHENGLVGLAHKGWSYRPGTRTFVHELNDAGYHTRLIGYQHEAREDLSVMGYREIWGESWDAHDVAARAAEFFQSEATARAPFYLNCGFWEVHDPLDREKYTRCRPDTVEVPEFLPDTPEVRERLALLCSSITYMDEAVGTILAALDDSPVAGDTAVVFTTDHGIAFPQAKGTLYDAGIESALIIRTPGGPAGERCGTLLSNIDVAPTVLELAGVPVPERMRGMSFLPALHGEPHDGRGETFSENNYHGHSFRPTRAVRTETHKYIRSFGDAPGEELYDLRTDPTETKNLAGEPERSDELAGLRSRLEEWMGETNDWLPDGDPPTPPEGWPDRRIILEPGKDLDLD
jgi:arylsulfatase A-like enzyme